MGFFFPENFILAHLIYLLFVILNITTVYFIFEYFTFFRRENKKTISNIHKKYFFYIYLGYIFIFLFARGAIYEPFRMNFNVRNAYYPGPESNFFILVFNLFIFAPLAFIKQLKFYHIIPLFIFIELLQTSLGIGIFDINDIIFYFIGYTCTKLVLFAIKD